MHKRLHAGIVASKRLEIPQQCPKAVAQPVGYLITQKRPSFLVIVNLLQHSMMQMEPVDPNETKLYTYKT